MRLLIRSSNRPLLIVTALLVGAALVVPSLPAAASTVRYEAENALISKGTVDADHTGFTGTGFVNYDNVVGSYVQLAVGGAAQSGIATLTFRFAKGTTTNRPMDITVNGVVVYAGLAFPGTGSWNSWQTTSTSAMLSAGTNTVRATATTASGGPAKGYQGVRVRISLGSNGLTYLKTISVGTNVGDYTYYVNRTQATNDLHGLGAFLIMNEQLRSLS
jgi:hypothetical protein